MCRSVWWSAWNVRASECNGKSRSTLASHADVSEQLIEIIGGQFYDPLSYVLFAFDWGVGELKDHSGPDECNTPYYRPSVTA